MGGGSHSHTLASIVVTARFVCNLKQRLKVHVSDACASQIITVSQCLIFFHSFSSSVLLSAGARTIRGCRLAVSGS